MHFSFYGFFQGRNTFTQDATATPSEDRLCLLPNLKHLYIASSPATITLVGLK
jgi:hypothetical protein